MLNKPNVPDKLSTTAQGALSDLVATSAQWKYITQNLSTIDRCKLGRDILAKNQAESNLIRDIDLNGLGLHFKDFPSRI